MRRSSKCLSDRKGLMSLFHRFNRRSWSDLYSPQPSDPRPRSGESGRISFGAHNPGFRANSHSDVNSGTERLLLPST